MFSLETRPAVDFGKPIQHFCATISIGVKGNFEHGMVFKVLYILQYTLHYSYYDVNVYIRKHSTVLAIILLDPLNLFIF
jgi:hypothetical protein